MVSCWKKNHGKKTNSLIFSLEEEIRYQNRRNQSAIRDEKKGKFDYESDLTTLKELLQYF